MKKLSLILLCLLLLFVSGCNSYKQITDENNNDINSKITIEEPTSSSLQEYEETSYVENISEASPSSKDNDDEFDGIYFVNTNTKKFHKSTCASSKQIKEQNLYKSNSRQELINDGYIPCQRCNP